MPHLDQLPLDLETLRDRLAAFLRDEVRAAEQRDGVRSLGDATPELRRWIRRRADELGLFRLLQPVDLGGGGVGMLGQAALHDTIGASGTVLGELTLGGSGGLLRLGTPSQRERFLLPVLRGDLDAAFAFTDAREGPRTTARRRGDTFVVDGVKSFVTHGPHADLLLTVVNVVDSDGAGGPTGSAILVVRRDAPGVTLRRRLTTLDGDVHGEFELSGVVVPATDLIGQIGQGLPKALENITGLRLRAAALACGTGRFVMDWTLAHVTRPHRSGTPLAEREQVQAMMAEGAMDLFSARASLYAAARAEDDLQITMAKVLATEAVARIVDRAMQLTGGAAVVEDHPLAWLYRKIRGWRIGEGTTEVLKLTIARRLNDTPEARPW